jgi:hypothetical protein
MRRALVAAIALVALVSLTGLDGCRAYDVEVVVPPDARSMDDALVVIMDTRTGEKAVIPYPEFLKMDLRKYDGAEALQKALREKAAPPRP